MKYWAFLFLILLTSCNKKVNSDSIQRFKGTVVQLSEFILPTASAASGEICTSKKSAGATNYLELSLLDKSGSLKVLCATDIDSKGGYEFLINKALVPADAVLSVNGKFNGGDRSHITALNQLSTDNAISPLSTAVAAIHLDIIKSGETYSKDNTNQIKALLKAAIAQSDLPEVDYLKVIKDNGISTSLVKDAFNLSKAGNASAAAAKLNSFENAVANFSDPVKVALAKAADEAALLKAANDKIAADLAAAAKAVADQIAANIDAARAASANAAASAAAAKSALEKAIAEAAAKAAADAAIKAAAEVAAAQKAAADAAAAAAIKAASDAAIAAAAKAAADKALADAIIAKAASDKIVADKAAADAAILQAAADKAAADLAASKLAAEKAAADAAAKIAADIAAAAAAKIISDKAIADAAIKAAADAAAIQAAIVAKAASDKAAADLLAAQLAAIKAAADADAAAKALADKAAADAAAKLAAETAAAKAAADAAAIQAAIDAKALADKAAADAAAKLAAETAAAKAAADAAAIQAAIVAKAAADKAAADAAAIQAAIVAKAAADKAAADAAVIQAAADKAASDAAKLAEETAAAKAAAIERSIANANDAQENYLGKIASFFTDLTITPQFDLESTGWINSSKEPISVNITSTSEKPLYKCRYAHTGLVSVLDFQECKIDEKGNLFLYPPEFGNTNGAFQLQVQAVSGEFATIAKTINFYVHDSLDYANVCKLEKTDEEYMALAAKYLNQSAVFTDKTNLKVPFISIGFAKSAQGSPLFIGRDDLGQIRDNEEREVKINTLRKRYVENNAKTLILIKRKYNSRFGSTCGMSSSSVEDETNIAKEGLSNVKLGYIPGNRKNGCEAVVISASGKGTCFNGDQIYAVIDAKRLLRRSVSQKFLSDSVNDFNDYNKWWNSTDGSNRSQKPILLDDDGVLAEKAQSDIATDEFGINILAMLNKDILESTLKVHVRDPHAKGVANDEETKAFLMYALSLTLDDIQQASLQNYLANISPEVLEKAFYFYKYGNKDLAKLTLENYGAATKSRAIASLFITTSPINIVNLIITPKFDLTSTGWFDNSNLVGIYESDLRKALGAQEERTIDVEQPEQAKKRIAGKAEEVPSQPIKVQITSKTKSVQVKCRFGHPSEILSLNFDDCKVDEEGYLSLSQPETGIKNGTFQLDVQASADGLTTTTKSISFYAHDSLNEAFNCKPPRSDDEYLQIAAKYLDQSMTFANGTSLKAPFVKVNFPVLKAGGYPAFLNKNVEKYDRNLNARGFDIPTLRKRFIANNTNTLILARRAYGRRFEPNLCGMHVTGLTINDWIKDNILAGGNPAIDMLRGETSENCDSLVMNAFAKGICFVGDKAYYVSDIARLMKTREHTDPSGSIYLDQKLASSKFSKAQKVQYDSNIANAQNNLGMDAQEINSRFIYLEDAEDVATPTREIASVSFASKMTFKIRDDHNGGFVSNEIALAFLAYGLRMTPENVVNPKVQSFLYERYNSDSGSFAKPMDSYYLYGAREKTIDVMESSGIAPKAREILGLNPIENTWKIVIRDHKTGRNLTNEEAQNFLADVLGMKIEEISYPEVQDYLISKLDYLEKEYVAKYEAETSQEILDFLKNFSSTITPVANEIAKVINAKIAQDAQNALDSKVFTSLSLTPNFDIQSTGWLNGSKASILVSIASKSTDAKFKCRFSHASEISVMAYTVCNIDKEGNLALQQPNFGVNNGLFQLDVQASSASMSASNKSISFYVHDSLNLAKACTPPKSDAEYMEIAAKYLDQSMKFEKGTSLKAPFVQINFPAVEAGDHMSFINHDQAEKYDSNKAARGFDIRTLRKRFVANDSNSLILIKRAYAHRFNSYGACGIHIGGVTNEYLDRSNGDWNWIPQNNNVLDGESINTTSRYRSASTSECDSLVINAYGKGLCFLNDKAFFVSDLGRSLETRVRDNGTTTWRNQKIASSKFTKAEKEQYESNVGNLVANGNEDADTRYIYLEDAAGPEAARDIASVNTAAKMTFKIVDHKTKTMVSNEIALEFLAYSLQMTPENIIKPEVQKYLIEVNKGSLEKALYFYLYEDRSNLPETMNSWGIGPKAREIAGSEAVQSPWKIVIRDLKLARNLTQAEMTNFLANLLNVKADDLLALDMQELLSANAELIMKAYEIFTYGSEEEKQLVRDDLNKEVLPRSAEIENALIAKIAQNVKDSLDTTVLTDLTLSPNFDIESTGWIDSSRQPLRVSLASKSEKVSYNCRFSHAGEISVIAFKTCALDEKGNVTLRQPEYGIRNGIFQLDVQASSASISTTTKSISFYVHDSLNLAGTCNMFPKSDAQYFETAAKYLDQSVAFGEGTSLKAPFVRVNLPAISVGDHAALMGTDTKEKYESEVANRGYDIRTLHKRFIANDNSTLILIKRAYDHSNGNCDMSFRSISKEFDLNAGNIPTSREIWKDKHYDSCDSVVMNAYGKGICFDKESAYFVSDLGYSMGSRSYYDWQTIPQHKQLITSSKFTSGERSQYLLAMARARDIGMEDPTHKIVYLEDSGLEQSDISRNIASIEDAAKMTFKIRDDRTGENVSDKVALEFLAYTLKMTKKNVLDPKVQSFLSQIYNENSGILAKPLNFYLYKDRDYASRLIEKSIPASRVRNILKVSPIQNTWKVNIYDEKQGRLLTIAETAAFLVTALEMNFSDIALPEVQNYLSSRLDDLQKGYLTKTYDENMDNQIEFANFISKEITPKAKEIAANANAQNAQESVTAGIFTNLTVIPAFDLVTTGWTDGNSEKIHADAASTTPNAVIKCRFGHASEISVLAFTDCSRAKDGNVILTQPDYGTTNGKFQLDVQATAADLAATTQTFNFYVHDSLNNSSTCPDLAKSDADYLDEAAQYLDQSLTFGDNTSLQSPQVNIEFPTIAAGWYQFLINGSNWTIYKGNTNSAIFKVRTLRKRFTENSAKTLILIKRFYDKRNSQGNCNMRIPRQARGNEVQAWDGNQWSSPYVDFNLAEGKTPQSSNGQKIEYGTYNCDTLVMNAAGRAVCFDHDKAYYAKDLKKSILVKTRMRNDIYSHFSKISSSKFTANEKDQYEYTLNAAAKNGMITDSTDPEHQFIYLDDIEDATKAASEARAKK